MCERCHARLLWIGNPGDEVGAWQANEIDVDPSSLTVTPTAQIAFRSLTLSVGAGCAMALNANGDALVATAVAESHVRMDRSRVDMIRGYAETLDCRRQFMLGYFGEALPRPCGHCDTCESGAAYAELEESRARAGRRGRRGRAAADPFPLNAAVTHREWGPGVVMRVEPDRITVLFESVGYKTLALAAISADDGILAAV